MDTLEIPGAKGPNPDLPRKPEEIRAPRLAITPVMSGEDRRCTDDGDVPGLKMGIFSGQYGTQSTGDSFLRQEAIAETGTLGGLQVQRWAEGLSNEFARAMAGCRARLRLL